MGGGGGVGSKISWWRWPWKAKVPITSKNIPSVLHFYWQKIVLFSEPFLLIMEYIMYGKLLTHLREQRMKQSSFFNFSKVFKRKFLQPEERKPWCRRSALFQIMNLTTTFFAWGHLQLVPTPTSNISSKRPTPTGGFRSSTLVIFGMTGKNMLSTSCGFSTVHFVQYTE